MANDTSEEVLLEPAVFAHHMAERFNDIEKRLTVEENVIAQLKVDNRQQRSVIEKFRKSMAVIDAEIAETNAKYMELIEKRKRRRVRSTADESDSASADGSVNGGEEAAQSDGAAGSALEHREDGSVQTKHGEDGSNVVADDDQSKCTVDVRPTHTQDNGTQHTEQNQSQHSDQVHSEHIDPGQPERIEQSEHTEFDQSHRIERGPAQHNEHSQPQLRSVDAQNQPADTTSTAIKQPDIPEYPSEAIQIGDANLDSARAVQRATAKRRRPHNENGANEVADMSSQMAEPEAPAKKKQKRSRVDQPRPTSDEVVSSRPRRKAAPIYLKEPSIRDKMYRF